MASVKNYWSWLTCAMCYCVPCLVPRAPTGVRVTSQTATSARVEWDPIVYTHGSIIAYHIDYMATQTASASTNLTSILLSGLTPYTKYVLTVAAVVRPQNAENTSEDLRSNRSVEHSFITLQSSIQFLFKIL